MLLGTHNIDAGLDVWFTTQNNNRKIVLDLLFSEISLTKDETGVICALPTPSPKAISERTEMTTACTRTE